MMSAQGTRGRGRSQKEEDWDDYEEMYVQCESENCGVWQSMMVKKGWKGKKKGSYFCGICLLVMVEGMRGENAKWRKRAEEAENKVKNLEKREGDKKEYAEVLKKDLRQEMQEVRKDLEEKRVRTEEEIKSNLTKEVRTEVVRGQREETRKKRVIIFGLKNDGENDVTSVEEILRTITREEIKPVLVERMREKEGEGGGSCRPVIVEFRTETEKWRVLEKKGKLRKDERFKEVFLEIDLPLEVREAERKKQWEKRRKRLEELKVMWREKRNKILAEQKDQLKEKAEQPTVEEEEEVTEAQEKVVEDQEEVGKDYMEEGEEHPEVVEEEQEAVVERHREVKTLIEPGRRSSMRLAEAKINQ